MAATVGIGNSGRTRAVSLVVAPVPRQAEDAKSIDRGNMSRINLGIFLEGCNICFIIFLPLFSSAKPTIQSISGPSLPPTNNRFGYGAAEKFR